MAYERAKDKEIAKFSSATDKRFLNIRVYSYDGGEVRCSIVPASKNTNPNCDPEKKWIKGKGISGINKDELGKLITALQNAQSKM